MRRTTTRSGFERTKVEKTAAMKSLLQIGIKVPIETRIYPCVIRLISVVDLDAVSSLVIGSQHGEYQVLSFGQNFALVRGFEFVR